MVSSEVSSEEYERGLRLLESLITGKKRQDGSKWQHAFEMMKSYLDKLSLTDELCKLQAIHVAGTKGKGSTCAMVDSILRKCGYRTGLFTSPHLIDVRERIRINGDKVDPKTFLRHLHEAYETLDGKTEEDSGKPAYFRFLTLLCFRIFLEAKVDVAILEVGLGGRLDATNCIQLPVVCGVSALGFDHMNVLGYTLPEISREKAGIFKQGCPAFSVPQKPDAMQTLEEVAESKQTPLSVIESLNAYSFRSNESQETVSASLIKLGLPGEHQRENAALAVKLAAVWESRCGVLIDDKAQERASMILEEYKLPKEYVAGLEDAKWPGRAEIFDDPESCNMTFFIDGAHTPESMKACAEWFSYESRNRSVDRDSPKRIVVFNCMEEREPENLMGPLQQTLMERDSWPEQVVFTPTLSSYTKLKSLDHHMDTSWQQKLKTTWDQLPFIRADRVSRSNGAGREFPINRLQCPTSVSNSLPEMLQNLRNTAKVIKNKRVHVLVTGSLYLVGDMLKLLGKSA